MGACSSELLTRFGLHLFMTNTCQVGDLPQRERRQVLCGKCFHLGGIALPAVYGSRSRDDWKQPDSGCNSQSEGLVCEDLRGSRRGQVDRDPAQEPFLKCSYSEVHSSDSCFKHL